MQFESVELYAQDRRTGIRTNCSQDVFLTKFSEAIVYEILSGHLAVDLRPDQPVPLAVIQKVIGWMEDAFEINAKLKGYKSERVMEQRVLWRSSMDLSEAHKLGSSEDFRLAEESESP